MKVHDDQCQTCTPVFINSTLTRPSTQPINSQYNSEGMYIEGSLNFPNSAAKIDCEYNYNYLDKQLYKTKFNIAPWEILDESAETPVLVAPQELPCYKNPSDIRNYNPKLNKYWPSRIPHFVFPVTDYKKIGATVMHKQIKTVDYAIDGELITTLKQWQPINSWWYRTKNARYEARKNITGFALNVNESPYCVIDFDVKGPKQCREQIRNYILKKYNITKNYVIITSGGIHYYTRGGNDKTFEQYLTASRMCGTLKETNSKGQELYSVDVFVCNQNCGKSGVMLPGSETENHDKDYGVYKAPAPIKYSELEAFSAFEERCRIANAEWLVKPKFATESKSNFNTHSDKSHEDQLNEQGLIQNPDWTIIESLKNIEIHANTGIRAYSLMLSFACFSDENYDKCIKFLLENCSVSSKAKVVLETPLAEIRSSKYFNPKAKANAKILRIVKSN